MPIRVGTFSLNVGEIGPQTIEGVGFKPKAVYFLGVGNQEDDNTDNYYPVQLMRGVATLDGQIAVCNTTGGRDDGNPSLAGGGKHPASCILYTTQSAFASGTCDTRAQLYSFDNDGFTIDIIENNRYNTETRRINYMAFGGSDVSSSVMEKQVVVPLVGFSGYITPYWDSAFVFGAGAVNSGIEYGVSTGGFQAFDGFIGLKSDSSYPVNDVIRGMTQGGVCCSISQPSGLEAQKACKSHNTSNFLKIVVAPNPYIACVGEGNFAPGQITVDYTTTSSNTYWINLFMLRGYEAHVQNFSNPTSPGLVGYVPGFRPDGIIIISTHTTAPIPGPTGSLGSGLLYCIGMTDGVNQACTFMEYGTYGTSAPYQRNCIDHIIHVTSGSAGTTDLHTASISSITPSGFILNWQVANTTSRIYQAISFKEKVKALANPNSYLVGRV